jgi:hypothetical protein
MQHNTKVTTNHHTHPGSTSQAITREFLAKLYGQDERPNCAVSWGLILVDIPVFIK